MSDHDFSIFAHEKEADNRNQDSAITIWSIYTVILCKHQLVLVFVDETFFNHQLDL